MRYRALVLRQTGLDPCLTELELRSSLNRNQVLVKILNTGICGKQLEEINGANGLDVYIPHCLGHEGAGLIIDVGKDVKNVTPGDSVVLHWITEFDCGQHVTPLLYDLETKEYVNCGPITTFSEYSVVSCNRVTKIDSDVSSEIASLLGCGLTTGLGSVFNEARVSTDDNVLIVGCGGVGLSIVQGCKIAGAKKGLQLTFQRRHYYKQACQEPQVLNTSDNTWAKK